MNRNPNNINSNNINANASLSRAKSGVKYFKVEQNSAAKQFLKQAKQNPIRTAGQGAARVGTGLATYAANIGRMGPVVEELEKWAISQGANITGRALTKQKFDSDSHRIAQIQIMQNTLNIMRLKELIMNQSLLIYNLSNVLLEPKTLKALNITKFPCYSDGTKINPEKFKSFMQKHNVPEDELIKMIKKNPITAMLYVEKLDFIQRQIGMVNWFQSENNNEGSEGSEGNNPGSEGNNPGNITNELWPPSVTFNNQNTNHIGGKKKSIKPSVKKQSVKSSTKKKPTKSSSKKKPTKSSTKSSTKKKPTKSSTKKKPTKSSTKKQVKK